MKSDTRMESPMTATPTPLRELIAKWRAESARHSAEAIDRNWSDWVREKHRGQAWSLHDCANELEAALSARQEEGAVACPTCFDRRWIACGDGEAPCCDCNVTGNRGHATPPAGAAGDALHGWPKDAACCPEVGTYACRCNTFRATPPAASDEVVCREGYTTMPEVRFARWLREMDGAGKSPSMGAAYEDGYQHGVAVGKRVEQMREELRASPEPPGGEWVLVPREIVDRFPEINPSNYDHDDACALNAWGVELVLAAAPSPEARPGAGQPEWNRHPWRNHDDAISSKSLATAKEIELMWGEDRTQFVERIQAAVLDAMGWMAGGVSYHWLNQHLNPREFAQPTVTGQPAAPVRAPGEVGEDAMREVLDLLEYATYHDGRYGQMEAVKWQDRAQKLLPILRAALAQPPKGQEPTP